MHYYLSVLGLQKIRYGDWPGHCLTIQYSVSRFNRADPCGVRRLDNDFDEMAQRHVEDDFRAVSASVLLAPHHRASLFLLLVVQNSKGTLAQFLRYDSKRAE